MGEHLKVSILETDGMIQRATCIPHNHEDLNSAFKHLCKKAVLEAEIYTSSECSKQKRLRALLSVIPVDRVSSRFNVSKNILKWSSYSSKKSNLSCSRWFLKPGMISLLFNRP